MNYNEMFAIVSEILRDCAELQSVEITPKTDPFKDLGKDSHDGLVFACLLSERLGIEVSEEDNPLVDDKYHRARLVGEVVDWCMELVQKTRKDAYAGK